MKSKIHSKNAGISFAILIAGIIFTILITIHTKKKQELVTKHDFELVCNEVKTKIVTRLHAHALLLRSASSFFAASDSVSRKDWEIFIENSKIEKNLPGIQGVGYAVIIKKEQLQQHIKQIRAEGFPEYTIRPAGDRELYTSIIFLEPFKDRNLLAFGYDMFQEPTRRKAMEYARDYDVASLSGKVTLVQETDKAVQPGTLMYVPVYRKGMPANTIAERRAAIIGWVYSPYRMIDLMHEILGVRDLNDINKIRLKIYDNNNISQNYLLFDSQQNDTIIQSKSSVLTHLSPINFNNKRWTLQFSKSTNWSPYLQSKVLIVLISGLIISLLLFTLSLLFLNSNYRAQQLALRLTSELQESEKRFSLFMDYLPAIVFLKDNKGKALFVNKYMDDVLGASEWLGKDMVEVLPNEQGAKFLADDLRVLKSGYEKIEECMMLQDGKMHYFETQKFIISRQGQEPFLGGISLDITERKQAEEELLKAKLAAEINSANFTAILGSTVDSIWAFDRNYDIVFINKVFQQEFYQAFGVWLETGMSLIDSLPENLRPIWKPRYDAALCNEHLEFEDAVDTGFGKIFIRVSMNSIIKDGEVIGGSCFGSDITERRLAEEELKVSREQLSNFASHLQNVREKERLAITLEIHDSLAQFLAALKIDMGIFRNKLMKKGDTIDVKEVLSEIQTFIFQTDNTIKSARRIMNGLRPEQLELLGFVEASEVYLNDFEEAHHIKCEFETQLQELHIHPEHAIALFRILQESLNNVLKHAMATLVKVQLTNIDDKLILEIADNGVGFDKNNCGRPDSYGLISMKEQLKLINGNFEINSKIGEGTCVRVEIPV